MRILYLHQYFCLPGGNGNDRSLQFSRFWKDAGHEVIVLTSDAYFPESEKSKDKKSRIYQIEPGIEIHILPVPYSHMMPFRQRIKAFLQFYRMALKYSEQLTPPDMIYASSTPLTVGELGRKLAAKWKRPFVFETVDVWPDVPIGMKIIRNPMLIWWLHKRTNRIYREASSVITLSEGMRDQVISHGVPPGKVKVVHNGTDPKAFASVQRPWPKKTVVLYAGTVGKANDLTLLLDAVAMIELMGKTDIVFRIMGDGNDLERVRKKADSLQLKTVEFLPPVPKAQMQAELQKANIGLVCFASSKVLEANSANKFFDYLAAGLPVVINYQGWQAEYLSKYKCGYSSSQKDSKGLLINLLMLAEDVVLRRDMGVNGAKLAKEKFDRKKLAELVLREFENILKT